MTQKINTHLANDLEQSAAMLDSREFDAVQLDNCASMMRYAATVIRQALANEALDKMADNARELGLSYDASVAQIDTSPERVEKEAGNKDVRPPNCGTGYCSCVECLFEQPAPPECKTEAEKTAFAFGWFKALESVREQPAPAQEPVTWRDAAIRIGEDLCSVGPFGYYDMTAQQWLDWALSVVTVHAPPAPAQPWVGLTNDERKKLADVIRFNNIWYLEDMLRAAEEMLERKNT